MIRPSALFRDTEDKKEPPDAFFVEETRIRGIFAAFFPASVEQKAADMSFYFRMTCPPVTGAA